MTSALSPIAPREIWTHFEALNAIPRGSKKEAAVIEFIQKSKENGAPGMQPNLYKVVYYQWLSKVHFWKSGLLQID